MEQIKKIDKLVRITALIALLAFIFCGFFAQPITDDYSYANVSREKGLIAATADFYMHWSGRYTGNGFAFLMSGTDQFLSIYGFIGPGLILSTLLSFWFALRMAGKRFKVQVSGYAVVLTVAYLMMLPEKAQSLYWLTGAAMYAWPPILWAVAVGLLFMMATHWRQSLIDGAFMMVIVLLCGCNEVSAFLTLSTLAGSLFFVRDALLRRRLWLGLGTAIIGSATIVLAPGNAVRTSMYHVEQLHDSGYALWFGGLATVWFIVKYLLVCIVLVGGYFSGLGLGPKQRLTKQQRLFIIGLLVAAAIYAVASTMAIGVWSTGERPPLRVGSMLVCIGLAVAVASGVLLGAQRGKFWQRLALWCGIGLIVMHMGYTLAIMVRISDYRQYWLDNQARYFVVRQNRGKDLLVPPLSKQPWPIFNNDLVESKARSHYWGNEAFAVYFGLRSVLASGRL